MSPPLWCPVPRAPAGPVGSTSNLYPEYAPLPPLLPSPCPSHFLSTTHSSPRHQRSLLNKYDRVILCAKCVLGFSLHSEENLNCLLWPRGHDLCKPFLPYLLPPTPHSAPASQPAFSEVNMLPSFLLEAFICAIPPVQSIPSLFFGRLPPLHASGLGYMLAPQTLLDSPI